MQRGTDGDSLSGWLALAAPLGLYLATLSPGVDFWDIGEMQTVPYLLGIAHPTGFPLVIVAGWLFTHALPFGEPAWRMSLFSAFAASVASRALYALVCDVTGARAVALASALVFALGDVVWTHAVRADVHDFALAAIAVALAAATRAGLTRAAAPLGLAALVLGIGLAIHPIVALAVPGALVLAWPALASARLRTRATTLALACAPLLAYAYVPLRSAYVEAHGDPGRELGIAGAAIFDTGAPSTPGAFWQYVTGEAFAPMHAFARASSAHGFVAALALAREVAYRNDGIFTLALALVGAVILVLKFRRIGIGLATVPVATLGFVANYPAESDVARYALPALWTLAASASVGAWWLANAIAGDAARARRFASTAAAIVLGLALLPRLAATAADVGRTTRIDDARELVALVAQDTVDGSLVVASWSFATPLTYEVYVAGRLGTRRVACGWPHDFVGRYAAWRARYRHVYFVLARAYDVTPFATPIVARGRWQLSELRT